MLECYMTLVLLHLYRYSAPKDYSIVTTFEVCDEWLLDLLQSIHFLGWGIGAIILGWAGDVYGRKVGLHNMVPRGFLV